MKRLVFRHFRLVNLLLEFVTISDEAFTLLLLENNVSRWNAMFLEGKENKADYKTLPQKFHSLASENTGGHGRSQQNDANIGTKDGYSLRAI